MKLQIWNVIKIMKDTSRGTNAIAKSEATKKQSTRDQGSLLLSPEERVTCATAMHDRIVALRSGFPYADPAEDVFNRAALNRAHVLFDKLIDREAIDARALADKSQDCDEDGEPLTEPLGDNE